ncbi:MAG: site-specific integrase [Coriobacteriia bacterium]|nr:site-specific integrase [Coriobacteriia bacterium]
MRYHVEPYRRRVDGEWKAVRNRQKVVIDLGMQPDHATGKMKRTREIYYFEGGKREAEADAQARVEKMMSGSGTVAPVHGTVGEWLDEWLRVYIEPKMRDGRLAASTVTSYRSIVRRYLKSELGDTPLKGLKPEHVTTMYAKMQKPKPEGGYGVSLRTRELTHVTLKSALKKAVELGRVRYNVLDDGQGVDRPTLPKGERKRPVNALEREVAVGLMAALAADSGIGSRLYLPALLALVTGMRRGEILALRRDDVTLPSESDTGALGLITVRRAWDKEAVEGGRSPVERYRVKEWPKSGAERAVDVAPEVVTILRDAMKRQDELREAAGELWFTSAKRADGTVLEWGDLIITDDHGFPWWPDSFSSAWKSWCDDNSIKCRFHDLRATSGSLALEAGIDPETVRQRLGHHSAAFFLERYAKPMRKAQERDAGIMGALVAGVVPDVGAEDEAG